MKKIFALIASVFIYMCLFLFFFHVLMNTRINSNTIFLGFSLSIIIFFVLAGNLFRRCLKIEWWQLWAVMNIIGLPLSVFAYSYFEPWQEETDILVLLFVLIPCLFIAWCMVGIGFLCVRFVAFLLKRQ